MVGVVDAVSGEQRLRVAGDQHVRFELADDADNVPAQFKIGDEVAILAIHEVDLLDADHLCCGLLLLMANGTQRVRGHVGWGGSIEALVAAGEELVGDMMSEARPAARVAPQKNSGSSG